ncbi:hypothetical protein [Occallatibacter riparius]|uniref:Uncharacterized protein n=1 Tax=Occallatibacter riparius TaxID=1002689 RepID=A0A9J7BN94_9BACT|nr:hypothetical protein [Occallatibacter riparius]UWZ84179.1 hypothetical protein MOP44_26955 [Occallatibacter riparius]
MGWRLSIGVVVLCIAKILQAETAQEHPVHNIIIVRGAVDLTSPQMNYRFAEWAQARGRWIIPDFAYRDTDGGKDQLWLAAVGGQMINKPRVRWIQQVYFSQEAGSESHNKRALWIWPVVDVNPSRKLALEVVPYPTIPLNAAQRWAFTFDRAKLERVGQTWNVGLGYQGGVCGGEDWKSKPFVLVTRKSRLGNLETWWQRLPDGAQVQLRYRLETGRR